MALFPMAKLAGLFVLVRVAVRTTDELVRCIRLVIWPAVALAVIAVGQTLHVGPVVSVLSAGWTADTSIAGITERGSTTLASSIATGDYLVVALALVVMLGVRDLLPRIERFAAAFVLLIGILASGQFSTWVATAVVAVVLGVYEPILRRRAIGYLPALPLVALVGAPAFIGRISGFFDGFGVPRSWLGRYDNLTHFYLPGLGKFRFLLGCGAHRSSSKVAICRSSGLAESPCSSGSSGFPTNCFACSTRWRCGVTPSARSPQRCRASGGWCWCFH
jgi:hypothetical protein